MTGDVPFTMHPLHRELGLPLLSEITVVVSVVM